MNVTNDMIRTAQRGEYDYYQRNRQLPADKFIPTPEAVIRAMLEAALSTVTTPEVDKGKAKRAIVYAPAPRRRR
jgi:hypothetical protein